MTIILGIESTAHTFGVAVVRNGKILSNVKRVFTTEKGGMIPMDVAKFHCENKNEIYFEALDEARIKEDDINAVAFSQGPGLAPCLLEGMKFAKELGKRLNVFLVPVNHCIAHLEIGTQPSRSWRGCTPKDFKKKSLQGARLTKARDPVMLYVSGANTQVIAYSSGKYRIFGETLDIGVGNFIDTIARSMGLGFPGGPKLEKLAMKNAPQAYTLGAQDPEKSSTKIFTRGSKYIELPYSVKGMDIALSGIQTKIRQLLAKGFKKEDLAYSMQETVFAMLVEVAERALAHTGKKELLLGGGVACNKRLQEMCMIMCKERGCKLFVPENSLLVDNAGMIAYLGEIMFKSGVKEKDLSAPLGVPQIAEYWGNIDIHPRERTDDVSVSWKD